MYSFKCLYTKKHCCYKVPNDKLSFETCCLLRFKTLSLSQALSLCSGNLFPDLHANLFQQVPQARREKGCGGNVLRDSLVCASVPVPSGRLTASSPDPDSFWCLLRFNPVCKGWVCYQWRHPFDLVMQIGTPLCVPKLSPSIHRPMNLTLGSTCMACTLAAI